MNARRLVILLLACGVAAPAGAQTQRLWTQPYVGGLSLPVGFVSDPTAPDRHFVVEQMGHIRVVVDGVLLAEDFLDLTGIVRPRSQTETERGLLGLALSPDYATSGRFFVLFTRESTVPDDRGDIVVSRFTRSADNPLRADPSSRLDLRWGGLTGLSYIEHTTPAGHNGGAMAFGADGYLYIGLGDGSGNGGAENNSQDPMEFKGKILRIDVNVPDADPQGYRVPADNPFVDGDPIVALPEIWAFGLRNPWRLTFDDVALGGTGALLIGDVGHNLFEEITYEPRGQGGRNYGWRVREGSNPYVNFDVPGYVAPPPAFLPLTDPVLEYRHWYSAADGAALVQGNSVTGGYVYRGSGLGEAMRGRYFFADFALARIWSAQVTPHDDTATLSAVLEHTADLNPGRLSSFAVDRTGELYLVKYGGLNQGAVNRVCGFSATPVLTSFSAAGGTGTIEVTAPAGCRWSVSNLSPGVTLVSNEQMSGSGVVQFKVATNGEKGDRDLSVSIAGAAITLRQRSSAATAGDIDGDGAPDLLWQHADGRLAAWLMTGTRLRSGIPLRPAALTDPAWRIAAYADFDGDANRDVVFQHDTDGRVAVWLMSGTMQLAGVGLLQVTDTNWKIRGAADMNRDGWTDLVWQHAADGRLAVWLMERTELRDGRLLTLPVVPGPEWRIAAVTDMNGDGWADFVWQNDATGLLSAWVMSGLDFVDGVRLTPFDVSDLNWKIVAAADYNLDGRADLIWQHRTSGLIAAWLMNGYELINAELLTPDTVSVDWKIVGPK